MTLSLNKTYFIYFSILLIVEVIIATFLTHGFIRHTFGDYLVVMLIYCCVKSIFNTKPIYVALAALIFAFSIEFLQLFNFLAILHLDNNMAAKLILGSTFHVTDLLAYTLGVLTIIIIEHLWNN